MADQRPPGDVSVKTRDRTVYYVMKRDGATVSSGSSTWTEFRSFRPSYSKGAVVTLPGGTTFRKATPYTHESWEVGQSNVATVFGKRGVPLRVYGAADGGREGSILLAGNPRLIGTTPPTDARNEAVTKALTDLANSKVNLGENLATLGTTVRLFTDRGKTLRRALQSAYDNQSWRPYLFKSFRQLLKEGVGKKVAQEYLAYIYGLKPLVEDVYTLHKLLKEQANSDLLVYGKGSAQRTTSKSDSQIPGSYTQRSYNAQGDTVVKVGLTGRVDENVQGLRALNQLGLANPYGLAWDLIPWSFVVDWFVPIGPVLYALTAPLGLVFVDGWISCRSSEVWSWTFQIDAGSWSYKKLDQSSPADFPVTYEGYGRSKLTNWPLPGFWVKPDPFGADRSMKALALAIVVLSDSKRSLNTRPY